jgi:2-methylcitrate dehydratase PrpD
VSINEFHNATAIEALVDNISETRFESFNKAIIENAKNRIIDTVGCLIAGANAPGNLELVDLVKDWGGKEEATILIHGGRAPAQNVAMVNSIMARSFDSEPNGALVDGTLIPSHISGTTVMTAIAVGEIMSVSGKELITAMLAGEDLASRILAAASPRRRVDSIGTVNVFGAAAMAGRLLGLNKSQMRNALGISLDHLSGSYQNVWDGTFAFKLSQGLSARSGIFSAQLAQRGWTATKDPLLGKFAYYYLYFDDLTNIEILTKDLGKKYYTEAHFKPYVSCRYNHGPIECVLSLITKYQIKAEDVKEIIVYVSRTGLDATVGRPFRIGDFPYANALFSYQYAVANALLRRSVRPEHFSEESIREPEINAFISRIKLAELPEAELLASKLEVIMNDGRKFSESTDIPKGDQDRNPMSKNEIIAKFWANVDFAKTVTKKNARELLRLLDKLEELDELNEIIKLLVV